VTELRRRIGPLLLFRALAFSSQTGEIDMLRKVVTLVLIGASVAVAACNTVRGAAKDVNSAANAVDNAT
jgi:predicted small secreted protein